MNVLKWNLCLQGIAVYGGDDLFLWVCECVCVCSRQSYSRCFKLELKKKKVPLNMTALIIIYFIIKSYGSPSVFFGLTLYTYNSTM